MLHGAAKKEKKKKSCFSALRKLLGIAQRELLLLFHLNFLHPIARIEKLPSALKNTRKQSKTHILTIKLSDSKKCFWSGRIGTKALSPCQQFLEIWVTVRQLKAKALMTSQ